jgi:hypothetical protein
MVDIDAADLRFQTFDQQFRGIRPAGDDENPCFGVRPAKRLNKINAVQSGNLLIHQQRLGFKRIARLIRGITIQC